MSFLWPGNFLSFSCHPLFSRQNSSIPHHVHYTAMQFSFSRQRKKKSQFPKTRTWPLRRLDLFQEMGKKVCSFWRPDGSGLLCHVQVLFRFLQKGLLIQVELVILAWFSSCTNDNHFWGVSCFCFFPLFLSPHLYEMNAFLGRGGWNYHALWSDHRSGVDLIGLNRNLVAVVCVLCCIVSCLVVLLFAVRWSAPRLSLMLRLEVLHGVCMDMAVGSDTFLVLEFWLSEVYRYKKSWRIIYGMFYGLDHRWSGRKRYSWQESKRAP